MHSTFIVAHLSVCVRQLLSPTSTACHSSSSQFRLQPPADRIWPFSVESYHCIILEVAEKGVLGDNSELLGPISCVGVLPRLPNAVSPRPENKLQILSVKALQALVISEELVLNLLHELFNVPVLNFLDLLFARIGILFDVYWFADCSPTSQQDGHIVSDSTLQPPWYFVI